MTTNGRPHALDIGIRLAVTFKTAADVAVNISTASLKQLIIEKPDGTAVARALTFTTDGTNGQAYYVNVAADFPVAGYYYLQGRVTLADGSDYRSDRVRVRVMPNNATPA